MLGCMHDQPTPSAADVEQTLAWLEAKLATDQIELGFLRGIQ